MLISFFFPRAPSAPRLFEKARICIYSKEREWKAALAEAIDTSQLPQEYGGTAPALADTPLLHEVHRALERDAAAVAVATAVAKAVTVETVSAEPISAETITAETVSAETVTVAAAIGQLDEVTAVEPTSDDGITAKTMAAILLHFSLDAHEYNFRRNCTVNESPEGDDGCGSGGSVGDPVVETSKFQATSDPPTPGSEELSGSENLVGPEQLSRSEDLAGPEELPGSEDLSGSQEDLSGSEDLSGTADMSGSEEDPSVTSERSAHATSVGHETQDGKSDGGDFEWVLNFVPGARLATGVAGVVIGNTFGAALTVAGFAAGVLEAVVPDVVWAEGVRAFEESRFCGRRSLGAP